MNDIETKILTDFNSLKDALNRWGKFVDETILSIINVPFISEHKLKIPCSYRLKEDKSYISKALYRGKQYDDPLKKIEDKIGTRLVLLTTDDVEAVSKVLLCSDKWHSKVTKDINTLIDEEPEKFSYQSIHVVVWPLETDSNYVSGTHEQLTCEIQIRTLLQHAYSEISHDSTYKGPFKNDKEILRQLAKSMALMEATDDYFCNIFKNMSDDKRKYANFINELITLYSGFNASFKREELDFDLTKFTFLLLDKKDIAINDIQDFCVRNKADLSTAIVPQNGYLFEQPICILLSYYFFKHRNFLRNEWPLSLESLQDLYRAFNTSFDSF